VPRAAIIIKTEWFVRQDSHGCKPFFAADKQNSKRRIFQKTPKTENKRFNSHDQSTSSLFSPLNA
jgi:hypothetical protein